MADKAKSSTGKGKKRASDAPKKISLSELRTRLRDPESKKEDFRDYFKLDPDNSQAFAPKLVINEDLVDTGGLEADLAIGFFNGVSRRWRETQYRRRIREGYNGIRIVSEGDSWFQYPILLDDVIDNLSETYAIYSLGGAGHLLADMVAEDELTAAIADERPDVFLLSGGGNDLLGEGMLKNLLHPFQAGRPARNYLNQRFEQELDQLETLYEGVFTRLTRRFPRLKILCHGYDHAIPNKGRWLGRPMQSLKITDRKLQAEIVSVLIDRFNTMLQKLAGSFPGAVHYVDCRGLVGTNRWDDELHPTNAGFQMVAAAFNSVIQQAVEVVEPEAMRDALCPGAEGMVENPEDLDEAFFRWVVARRARTVSSAAVASLEDDNERRSLESQIEMKMEKIHRGSDFLPSRFLSMGAMRARAVCRIVTPDSLGSGFLVASKTFVMTNHHVLPDSNTAAASVAEFGFEEGGEIVRIALDPSRFFINDAELDFAIAACDGTALEQVEPIPLLRNPANVTRGDRVNIVQHPRGRAKEIAIHDNRVQRLKDKVVWYRTDTEPGSSGSPVFNNGWDLVALHHAGFQDGQDVFNEGIRISSIVSHLIRRGDEESHAGGRGIRDLLNLVPDTSPMLGFFDIAGVKPDDMLEVEVPHFSGSGDFADLGFWNIEHFNAGVSEQRVNRVAEVLHRLNMDVMGLTEVHRDALSRLQTTMLQHGDAIGFELLDTSGSQDIAVLYDRDTTTVRLADEISSRHADALNSRTASGRTAFPRHPLFAYCRVSEGNGTAVEFIMIVVHLKAFGDAQSRARRRLAASILAEIIEDIRDRMNLPVVLGGDFNEKLNNDVLSALTDSPDLFALTADDAVTGAASYIGGTRRSLIDHIITSRDVHPGDISGDDAAIVRLDRAVSDFSEDVSDHVPVVMRLVMRDHPIDGGDTGEPASAAILEVPDGTSRIRIDFEN